MAIAGALVTAPQVAHAATAAKPAATAAGTASTAASTAQHSAAALRGATQHHSAAKAIAHNTYYKVRSGDTLSKIAGDFYHKTSDWQWLYHENQKRLSSPDSLHPGESLFVPADPPAGYSLPSSYQPRHAKPAASTSGSHSDEVATQAASVSSSSASGSASAGGSSAGMSGTLGCSGLERLWEAAGGNAGDAVMAASIAMAESGGNQYAHSPTDDYGYWQINGSNGSLATFDPLGNARAAIQLSNDGSNWSQWSTYTSGAYSGRC